MLGPFPKRLVIPALGGVFALALAGCGSDPEDPPGLDEDAEGLARFVCLKQDVPESYLLQTEGTLDADDLAAFSQSPDEREEELKGMGLREGYLSYWREEPRRPPFEDPNHLFCQALQFEDEQGALLYLHSVRPRADDIASTAITFLPEVAEEAEEVTDAPGLKPGSRAFVLRASDEGDDLTVNVILAQQGRYVVSVLQGGAANPPALAASFAVLDGLVARAAAD